MKKQRKENGITLIALVITIIILIILAGISIGMLVGDNGIINKAREAKENTQKGQEQEEQDLQKAQDYIDEQTGFVEDLRDDTTDASLQSLKILVNSGSDGIFLIRAGDEVMETDTVIDWGDGTIQNYAQLQDTIAKESKQIQVASMIPIQELQVSPALMTFAKHTYPENNKEYIITITGTYKFLGTNTENKIIEIKQWGTTGLLSIRLTSCSNLRKIVSPTKNSFKYIDNFYQSFLDCSALTSIPENFFANCPDLTLLADTFGYCTSLTSIPSKLFANCQNVNNFSGIFTNCTSITSIPENLFGNCQKVTDFSYAFSECTSLKGNPIKLWERVPNGNSNDYKGTPDGMGCYRNCTMLDDYEAIPEYWRTTAVS
ncbi:MAG: hypothetical protein ACLS95_05035 [Clostridia bacterium]